MSRVTHHSRFRLFFIALGFVLLLVSGACSSSKAPENERTARVQAGVIATITSSANTFIRADQPDETHGSSPTLRVGGAGRARTLIHFDSAAIGRFAEGDPVTLRLRVNSADANWGEDGQVIALHRLTHEWSEAGTWNCATDSDPWNEVPDCSGDTAWNMGPLSQPTPPDPAPWVAEPTATVTIHDGQVGEVEFEVTADVAAFRAGTPNYGWILKVVDESAPGLVEFTSRWMDRPAVLLGTCDDVDEDGRCDAPASGSDGGTTVTGSTVATLDTDIRSDAPNATHGTLLTMRVGGPERSRALLRFDSEAMSRFVDGQPVTVELKISSSDNTWGEYGQPLAVHRLLHDWSELATWNCSSDSDPSNDLPDCSGATAWDMGPISDPVSPRPPPWVDTPTTSVTITNGAVGYWTFDLTADIAAFRAGAPNYGWIIKKMDESTPGTIEFGTREDERPPRMFGSCTETNEDGTCKAPADAGTDSGSDGGTSDGGQSGDGGGSVCVPANCDDGTGGPCMQHECTSTGCVHTPAPDGTSCNDGNACTSPDTCRGGVCGGSTVTCSSSSPCMVGTCDPSTGCSLTPAAAGTSCESDNNLCSGISTCDGAGNCLPGTPPTCVSDNPCMVPSCDPILGCQLIPVANGTSCDTDNDVCNGTSTCNNGTCQPGTPLNCSSTNPCQIGTCDAVLGCQFTAVADNTSCETDNNVCNGISVCQSAQCVPGTAPTLSDNDACTDDACDPVYGVTHTPNNGPSCALLVLTPSSIDPTVPARMADATAFIYSGSSPVQTGVSPGTIDPVRAGIVRGRVLDTDGATPKSGVTVTILGHPEYGQTRTRENGEFDLAVNGGASYVVNFAAAGYITLQRAARPTWQGWDVVDDVVLTQPYTSPDLLTAGSPTPQVVHGFLTPAGEDADDARRATILFPENTRFTNFGVPDGTQLEVQLTELTRGPNGPRKMPADLPPTSGYTYAFEASIPAATAAGVNDIQFDRDVVVYIDNFTHFPIGQPVPLGYYDRTKGAWMGENSGRIIKILTTASGSAMLDVTGDGVVDTGTSLSDLGITSSELQTLAGEYAAGTELWRVTLRHFSDWDSNWGFGPPPGGRPPPKPVPFHTMETTNTDTKRCGSIIGCESRTLGERLPIVGTPFALTYQSDRTVGWETQKHIEIPITDSDPLPSSLLRAVIEIDIAGRHLTFERPAPLPPNDTFAWTWDQRDAYGREIHSGKFDAHIRVGFEYAGVATTPKTAYRFADLPGSTMVGNRRARTFTFWRELTVPMEVFTAQAFGFGGWTLDVNHVLDLSDSVILYKGDGSREKFGTGLSPISDYLNYTIDTVAGNGQISGIFSPPQDGVLATHATIGDIQDIAQGPDGTLYLYGYNVTSSIRQVRPDGLITTIAGLAPLVPLADGGPALHAKLPQLHCQGPIAIGPDGSVFFVQTCDDSGHHVNQVWKIAPGPQPTIRLVAGNAAATIANNNTQQWFNGEFLCPSPAYDCGEGGDARNAILGPPQALAMASDGTIFILDSEHARVWRVGPEGTISTYFHYVGPRMWWGQAVPSTMSLRNDGVLFVMLNDSEVIRVDPSGDTKLVVTYNTADYRLGANDP